MFVTSLIYGLLSCFSYIRNMSIRLRLGKSCMKAGRAVIRVLAWIPVIFVVVILIWGYYVYVYVMNMSGTYVCLCCTYLWSVFQYASFSSHRNVPEGVATSQHYCQW